MQIHHHILILGAGLGCMQLLLYGLLKGGLMGAPVLRGVYAFNILGIIHFVPGQACKVLDKYHCPNGLA